MPDQPALDQAAEEYISRQRKWKTPRGTIDSNGIWRPDADERRACCDGIAVDRYSLKKHCRTLSHVANLYGVGVYDLSARIREPVL